jgi:hypothetical protein
MAALFYNYGDNGLFKGSVSSHATPAFVSIFSELVGEDSLCIITQVGITMTETIQFFQTFDDLIHYYWFGKGLGNITIQGMLFTNCEGDFPGMPIFLTMIGQQRGKLIECHMGGVTFKGVMQDCNITLTSEPETIANFSISLAMTENTLPPADPVEPSC